MPRLILAINQETLNMYDKWLDSFKKRLTSIGTSKSELEQQILLSNNALVESGLNVLEMGIRGIVNKYKK